MKRHITAARRVSAAIFVTALTISATLAVASCDADPIFASIEEEVALADPSIRGTITSMVFTGDAEGTKYATNGAVYRKTGASGSWEKTGLPEHRCAQLAFDGTNVYGLMQNTDYGFAGVYMLSGAAWTKVTGSNSMVLIFSGNGFVYGFTHDGDEDGGTYDAYTVTASGATSLVAGLTDIPSGSAVVSDGSASWFSTRGGVYDSTGVALTGAPSGVLAMTASDAGGLYAASSSTLYQWNGSAWSSAAHEGAQTGVASVSWLRVDAATGVILVAGGDTSGYSEVPVTSAATAGTSILGDSKSLGGSITSLPSEDVSQYDSTVGQWTVNGIYADASTNSTGGNPYVLYACVVNDRGYDGLWAYYPSTRSEWNRE